MKQTIIIKLVNISREKCSHLTAHHEAQPKVKAALVIHGVMEAWQSWPARVRPVVIEGIVPETVIGTASGGRGEFSSKLLTSFKYFNPPSNKYTITKQSNALV